MWMAEKPVAKEMSATVRCYANLVPDFNLFKNMHLKIYSQICGGCKQPCGCLQPPLCGWLGICSEGRRKRYAGYVKMMV
jgi:hypothetical protein